MAIGCASYLGRKASGTNRHESAFRPQKRRACEGERASERAPEGAKKVLRVRVDESVRHDLVLEHPQLFLARQGAVYEQVRGLEVRRVQRELLDRIAAVAQDSRLAIDVRDLALDDGRVKEALVGHAEALGRLVLDTFPRFQRGGNRLEGRRRDSVILDPINPRPQCLTLHFTHHPRVVEKDADGDVRNIVCLPGAVVANGETLVGGITICWTAHAST